jgi:hypothetical protein
MIFLGISAGKTLTNWFPGFLTTPLRALPGPMAVSVNHLCSGSIYGLRVTRIFKIPTQKWKMHVLDIGAGKTFTNWFPNFLKAPPSALQGPMMALMNHLCSGSMTGRVLWMPAFYYLARN